MTRTQELKCAVFDLLEQQEALRLEMARLEQEKHALLVELAQVRDCSPANAISATA